MHRNYLKIIDKILQESPEPIDSIIIFNRDGIMEYPKRTSNNFLTNMTQFNQGNIGKHILDIYPNINEETSTVFRTLRTGKISRTEKQTLCSNHIDVTISSTTYPIFDDDGKLQGAAEAVRILNITNDSATGSEENQALKSIISVNSKMMDLKKLIREVAKNDSPVFIYGETGTGKELVAEALHKLSPRSQKPFISQNCAAIPQNLMESTFFGTEKGGFTGAESKQGLFELAHGGTLFLDEINSMDPAMQVKLLKVLEEQQVRRVGGEKTISFDVRIICASNEKATDLLDSGRMRSDFYYRISVVKADLPPLRDRAEDIPLLSDHFIKYFNKKMNKKIKGLSAMTEDIFMHWHWPGNIRELRGAIESAFNKEESDIITMSSIADLIEHIEESERPSAVDSRQTYVLSDAATVANPQRKDFSLEAIRKQLQTGTIDLKTLLEDYERAVIGEALMQNRKLNAVADKLSMSPQKLNYRINKLNLK